MDSRPPKPDPKKPKTQSLAERVYAQVRADIFDFRLLPGDRFTETEIALRTGVSRTPVRHALYRLQHDGLIDVHFRNGWQVKYIDFEQIDACYEVRLLLECAAIDKLCSGSGRLTVLLKLAGAWQIPFKQRLSNAEAVFALDEQFHYQLVEASGNVEMARVHQELTEKIRIVRRLDFTQAERVAATYDEHAAILTALREGNAAKAKGLLTAHINVSRVEVRKITLHRLFELGQKAAGPSVLRGTAL